MCREKQGIEKQNSNICNQVYFRNCDQKISLILLVDDDISFLEVSKQILETEHNFQVDVAASANKALKMIDRKTYDVIVSDYEMPEQNGLEFLKELRVQGEEIPFIIFTGRSREELAIQSLNLGADYYISKVGQPETVYCELAHHILLAASRYREKIKIKNYATALQSVEYAIFVIDNTYNVTEWNLAAERIFGYRFSEVVGCKIDQIFESLNLDILFTEVIESIKETGKFHEEIVFNDKHGEHHYGDISVAIQQNDKGKNLNFIIVCQDITKRKKADNALRLSEERYKALFEKASDAILLADPETGIIVDCNQNAERLTGRKKEELIGLHQREIHFPEEKKSEFSKGFIEHAKGNTAKSIETKVLTKNGELKDVTITATMIKVNGKRILQGIFRDMTEYKKILEQLCFQRRLLDTSGQAIIMIDKYNTICYWNSGAEKLFGWFAQEILGCSGINLLELVYSASESEAKVITERLISGESWHSEGLAKRQDGSEVPLIVNQSPLFDSNGAYNGAIIAATDISDLKMMEKELATIAQEFLLSSELIQLLNEKLKVVGSLTRHDVRNKLAVLNGQFYLLKKEVGVGNNKIMQKIIEMERVTKQMSHILEFERFYEHVNAEDQQFIDVDMSFGEAVALVTDLRNVNVVCKCQNLYVLADSLLIQILYNLIDNTLKYGKKTTVITLSCLESTNGLLLVYEDDGVGISEEYALHLFEKGFGCGTGYGLYLLKRICDAYGWSITQNGEVGKGAKFTMLIPRGNYRFKKETSSSFLPLTYVQQS